jgi:hypothetical protein
MANRKPIYVILSLILFGAGVLIGIIFFASTVWSDYEAAMFDASLGGDKRFSSLKCPILINSNETGYIRVTVENPTDQPTERTIHISKSGGFISYVLKETQRIPLAPGEERLIEWPVTQQDAAWGHFILNRAFLVRRHPLPSLTGSCGVLTADLGIFTGNQVVVMVFLGSLVLMGGGWGWWLYLNRPLEDQQRVVAQSMGWMGGVVLAGMIAGVLGWWVLGAIMLIAAVLLVVVILGGDPIPPLSGVRGK